MVTPAMTIQCVGFDLIALVWSNHFNSALSQLLVQLVNSVGAAANQALVLGFHHGKVNTQLHQGDFMMV